MNAFRLVATLFVVPAIVSAQPQTAKPGPEIAKFVGSMVGTWTYAGTSKSNPYSPAGKVTGTDVWEAGPGGFSVFHRWDEQDPFGRVTGLEIIGWDAVKKSLAGSYYSSLGEVGGGTLTVAGNTYTYTTTGATWEGKTAWSKCVWTFASAKSLDVKCDASAD